MSLARLKYQPSEEELPTTGDCCMKRISSNNSSAPSVVAPASQQQLQKQASTNCKNGTPEIEAVEQKEKRFPLKRDFTQNSVSTKEANDDDWAKRNQGKNKVLNLVAKFSQDDKNNTSPSGPSSYKTDYGVGKKVGQIQQNKFH